MYLIPNSGMTLQDLNHRTTGVYNYSDTLSFFETKDGTISLRSSNFKELFHSLSGAKKESLEKYIYPSELHRFKKTKRLAVLDVCFGMGYNFSSLIEALRYEEIYLSWWGLEIDKTPLKISLKNSKYKSLWTNNILAILESIKNDNQFKNEYADCKLVWGDARKTINFLPKNIKFDLIYLDAFSPQQCPELWCEEFLNKLSDKLSKNGRLITYSRAAAVRASLKRAGLNVKTIFPQERMNKDWSIGTLGIKSKEKKNQEASNIFWSNLSKMEEDHLKSIAAIPYRDPTGDSSKLDIISRRTIEQSKSNLKSTSLWKRQWLHTKDY